MVCTCADASHFKFECAKMLENFFKFLKFHGKTTPSTDEGLIVVTRNEKVSREFLLSLGDVILFIIIGFLCSFNFLSVCYVTYAFQSESILYSCLNAKELPARNRREIWSLSDCNGTRTHNHLVRKRTLNHLVKLAIWLSCV